MLISFSYGLYFSVLDFSYCSFILQYCQLLPSISTCTRWVGGAMEYQQNVSLILSQGDNFEVFVRTSDCSVCICEGPVTSAHHWVTRSKALTAHCRHVALCTMLEGWGAEGKRPKHTARDRNSSSSWWHTHKHSKPGLLTPKTSSSSGASKVTSQKKQKLVTVAVRWPRVTHQAAGEAVSVQVVLQQAGEAEEGQAGLLQAELDGLRGPHTGDQLRRKQQERPINNWHDSSLIIPVMYLSSSTTTRGGSPERRFSAGRAIHHERVRRGVESPRGTDSPSRFPLGSPCRCCRSWRARRWCGWAALQRTCPRWWRSVARRTRWGHLENIQPRSPSTGQHTSTLVSASLQPCADRWRRLVWSAGSLQLD